MYNYTVGIYIVQYVILIQFKSISVRLYFLKYNTRIFDYTFKQTYCTRHTYTIQNYFFSFLLFET